MSAPALLPIPSQPTMSSRQIADLLGSRHDKVKQSIERLVDRATIVRPPMGDEPSVDTMGRPRTERVYLVGKRDSYVIVAQLSPEFTARLVDRWQELEAAAAPMVPQSFADALQLAADQQRALVAQQAHIAVLEPKAAALDQIAEIGGSTSVTQAAKNLGIGPKDLLRFLSENRWIYRIGLTGPWTAYQDRIDDGYLVQKLRVVAEEHAYQQVRVSRKGLAKLGVLLNANVQLNLLDGED